MNLPIVLEGQVIGVVGVTGEPDAVRGSARLIRMITELVLERELTQQEMQSRQRLAEQFVEMLLADGSHYRGRINRAGKALGVDLELPRLVAVADVSGLLRGFSSEYGASELVVERSFEAILDSLTTCGGVGPQDVAVILDGRLVVLKHMPQRDIRQAVRAWGERLLGAFETWDVGKVACGVGALALGLEEYHQSYRQAKHCLRAGQGGPVRSVYEPAFCVGFLLEQLGASVPTATALRHLAQGLHDAFAAKPELRATLSALVANNFESEQTAFALGIHRNTLSYRLAGLREHVGLEPTRRVDDAVLLKMLLVGGLL